MRTSSACRGSSPGRNHGSCGRRLKPLINDGLTRDQERISESDEEINLALFHKLRIQEDHYLHNYPLINIDIEASLCTKYGGLTGYRLASPPSSPSYSSSSSIKSPAINPKPRSLTGYRLGKDLLIDSTKDSSKNDYDWLLTPPGTPLFRSPDKDTAIITASNSGIAARHSYSPEPSLHLSSHLSRHSQSGIGGMHYPVAAISSPSPRRSSIERGNNRRSLSSSPLPCRNSRAQSVERSRNGFRQTSRAQSVERSQNGFRQTSRAQSANNSRNYGFCQTSRAQSTDSSRNYGFRQNSRTQSAFRQNSPSQSRSTSSTRVSSLSPSSKLRRNPSILLPHLEKILPNLRTSGMPSPDCARAYTRSPVKGRQVKKNIETGHCDVLSAPPVLPKLLAPSTSGFSQDLQTSCRSSVSDHDSQIWLRSPTPLQKVFKNQPLFSGNIPSHAYSNSTAHEKQGSCKIYQQISNHISHSEISPASLDDTESENGKDMLTSDRLISDTLSNTEDNSNYSEEYSYKDCYGNRLRWRNSKEMGVEISTENHTESHRQDHSKINSVQKQLYLDFTIGKGKDSNTFCLNSKENAGIPSQEGSGAAIKGNTSEECEEISTHDHLNQQSWDDCKEMGVEISTENHTESHRQDHSKSNSVRKQLYLDFTIGKGKDSNTFCIDSKENAGIPSQEGSGDAMKGNTNEKCEESSTRAHLNQQSWDDRDLNQQYWDERNLNQQSCDERDINQQSCDERDINQHSCDERYINQQSCDDRDLNQQSCSERDINQEPCDGKRDINQQCFHDRDQMNRINDVATFQYANSDQNLHGNSEIEVELPEEVIHAPKQIIITEEPSQMADFDDEIPSIKQSTVAEYASYRLPLVKRINSTDTIRRRQDEKIRNMSPNLLFNSSKNSPFSSLKKPESRNRASRRDEHNNSVLTNKKAPSGLQKESTFTNSVIESFHGNDALDSSEEPTISKSEATASSNQFTIFSGKPLHNVETKVSLELKASETVAKCGGSATQINAHNSTEKLVAVEKKLTREKLSRDGSVLAPMKSSFLNTVDQSCIQLSIDYHPTLDAQQTMMPASVEAKFDTISPTDKEITKNKGSHISHIQDLCTENIVPLSHASQRKLSKDFSSMDFLNGFDSESHQIARVESVLPKLEILRQVDNPHFAVDILPSECLNKSIHLEEAKQELSHSGEMATMPWRSPMSPLMSRNMTLEDATDTVLFCSSIIHNIVNRASAIAVKKDALGFEEGEEITTIKGNVSVVQPPDHLITVKNIPHKDNNAITNTNTNANPRELVGPRREVIIVSAKPCCKCIVM